MLCVAVRCCVRRRRRSESHGAKLMPIPRQHHCPYAQLFLCDMHGVQHYLPLRQIAAPGVARAEAPVLREGDRGRDDLPVDVLWFGCLKEGQEVGELGGAQDSGLLG